ncbi:hypothetical protein BUALT_Bualt03G0039200 [Buddleja alternifolia]|uniref:Phosphate transporter n=1 Tax=Buddleja alternifolia TaxID=168488 RepID=A0AAV6XQV7_9LAMI|nr:hypothetical protein BUALT_Bualt03G0039200 [Buddleja alternifolia]
MASTNGSNTTSLELAIGIVGKWKHTYQWIPIFGGGVAVAMAFSAGANNIPISFSSLIGSEALAFFKVAIMAFVIYIPGATFACNSAVTPLLSKFVRENQPSEGFIMWSMVVVLITATIWLAVATYFALPVSSQQSTRAALLGTMLATKGCKFLTLWEKSANDNFDGFDLLRFFLEWTVAPLISCACTFCFFKAFRNFILRHENGEKRIFIFLPVYYGISAGLLCLFIMDEVIPYYMRGFRRTIIVAVAMATLLGALLSLLLIVPLAKMRMDSTLASPPQQRTEGQDQAIDAKEGSKDNSEDAVRDFIQMRVLNTVYEEDEQSLASPQISQEIEHILSPPQPSRAQSAAFKQLLESTPNMLIRERNSQTIEKRENVSIFIRDFIKSIFYPVIACDRKTLIRHALAEKFDEMEDLLRFPHILTSSIFALVQGVRETAALMSPFQAILEIFNFRSEFSRNDKYVGSLSVDWWFRTAGALGASLGFLLCGWRLTQCLANRLSYISNSRGVAFQLSAVATIILVNKANFPVSSVHTSIGALIGLGIADSPRNVNWKLLLKFVFGWVMTVIFCCLVAYGIFFSSIHSPSYVVP